MKDRNKNMDEAIRGKVYDYSATPPDSVWESIELSLQKNKRKKVILLYFKIAAGFIFLAGLTALFLKIADFDQKKPVIQVIANKQSNTIDVQENSTVLKVTNAETQPLASKIKIKKLPSADISASVTVYEINSDSEFIAISKNEETAVKPETNIKNEPSIPITNILTESDKPVVSDNHINEVTQNNPVISDNSNDRLFEDLLAADNESEKNKDMIWTIGGQAGPQYTYRRLTNENEIITNNTDYNSYDSPLLAYAGGLQIEVEPAKRLSIQSGIYYSKVGQKISSRYTDEVKNDYFPEESYRNNRPVEIVNSIGNLTFNDENGNPISGSLNFASNSSSGDERGNVTGRQYFEFIEIPFILKYKIIDQKMDFKIIGGVNTDILVNNYAKVTNSSNVTYKTKADALNTFNYSGTLGFGFDYPLSQKLLFSMEPFFKYYLSPINSSSAAEAHPYMFGIMTGLNYSF